LSAELRTHCARTCRATPCWTHCYIHVTTHDLPRTLSHQCTVNCCTIHLSTIEIVSNEVQTVCVGQGRMRVLPLKQVLGFLAPLVNPAPLDEHGAVEPAVVHCCRNSDVKHRHGRLFLPTRAVEKPHSLVEYQVRIAHLGVVLCHQNLRDWLWRLLNGSRVPRCWLE
jgi:hypothetical protein